MGAGVGAPDAELGQQLGDAALEVIDVPRSAWMVKRVRCRRRGRRRVSAMNASASSAVSVGRHHPADHVAAEDVDDHVAGRSTRPWSGPRSLVMSQRPHLVRAGRAISSGRTRAGWVAWRAAFADLAAGCAAPGTWSRSTPGSVPSSSRIGPHLGGGQVTRTAAERNSSSSTSISASDSLLVGEHGAAAAAQDRRPRRRGSAMARDARPDSRARARTDTNSAKQPRSPRRPITCFGFGSASALSASISKSACAFPMISNASLCLGQLGLEPLDPAVRLRQRRRIRVGLGRAAGGRSAAPAQRSASRARRHSTMWRGVQALPAQQGSLVAVAAQAVVLGQDRQLVLGSEPPSSRLGQEVGASSPTAPSWARSINDWHGHRCLLLRSRPQRDGGQPAGLRSA